MCIRDRSLYCAECNLRFSDKAKFARHKEKFCVGTKYYDPQALHNALHKDEAIKEMSFQVGGWVVLCACHQHDLTSHCSCCTTHTQDQLIHVAHVIAVVVVAP